MHNMFRSMEHHIPSGFSFMVIIVLSEFKVKY